MAAAECKIEKTTFFFLFFVMLDDLAAVWDGNEVVNSWKLMFYLVHLISFPGCDCMGWNQVSLLYPCCLKDTIAICKEKMQK